MASSISPSPYESFVNNKFSALFCQQKLSDTRPISSRLVTELSPNQRSKALEDLHGCVTDGDVQESAEFLSSRLRELEIELRNIQQKKRHFQPLSSPSSTSKQHETKDYNSCYYDKVMEMSPDYVRGLQLKCLRAKNYDPKQSAELLERFFELKAKLFGETTLGREITVADLPQEDIEYWKTGYMQILNQRDSAGRKVMFFYGKSMQEIPVITSIRLYFFLSMRCIEKEEDQKKGFVCILLAYHQTTFDPEKAVHFFAARDSLPTKVAALHQCLNLNYLIRFIPIIEAIMSAYDQCRHRVHMGSPLEVQYILMSFGIRQDSFPINSDGNVDMNKFQANSGDLIEELNNSYTPTPPMSSTAGNEARRDGRNLSDTYVPGPNDVIMGRHSQAVNAPGNVKLRKILEACREKYDTASHRMDKMVLTHHVFEIIKERGGRFIKQRVREGGKGSSNNNKLWEELSDEAAREKVSLGFRNLRRRSGAKPMSL